MEKDGREPNLEKVGCFFARAGERGFCFFESFRKKKIPVDGDIYVYNKGILWRVKP